MVQELRLKLLGMVISSKLVGVNLWVDGTYQSTGRTTAEIAARKAIATATEANMEDEDESVESAGVGFGTKLSYEGFSLVATGFYASGLGMRGQHSVFTYQTS